MVAPNSSPRTCRSTAGTGDPVNPDRATLSHPRVSSSRAAPPRVLRQSCHRDGPGGNHHAFQVGKGTLTCGSGRTPTRRYGLIGQVRGVRGRVQLRPELIPPARYTRPRLRIHPRPLRSERGSWVGGSDGWPRSRRWRCRGRPRPVASPGPSRCLCGARRAGWRRRLANLLDRGQRPARRTDVSAAACRRGPAPGSSWAALSKRLVVIADPAVHAVVGVTPKVIRLRRALQVVDGSATVGTADVGLAVRELENLNIEPLDSVLDR